MGQNAVVPQTPPKGWQYFTVHAITRHPETASGYDGKVATEMIGAKTGEDTDRWGWNPLRDHVAKTTARPRVRTAGPDLRRVRENHRQGLMA
jgi:hypothetical protein